MAWSTSRQSASATARARGKSQISGFPQPVIAGWTKYVCPRGKLRDVKQPAVQACEWSRRKDRIDLYEVPAGRGNLLFGGRTCGEGTRPRMQSTSRKIRLMGSTCSREKRPRVLKTIDCPTQKLRSSTGLLILGPRRRS